MIVLTYLPFFMFDGAMFGFGVWLLARDMVPELFERRRQVSRGDDVAPRGGPSRGAA